MFVTYYWIKNRSSCYILEPILCEPPYEVFYRPHLILTATRRQVSRSPSSRWTVLDCGSPRVRPGVPWKQAHKPSPPAAELPAPLSIWPHWTHAIFLWNKSMCQTEQIFFYVKIILILRYCPSAKHKGICNFGCLSILGLQLQLLLRFAVRIPYWYQLFHYWKWIYSCLQWQINCFLASSVFGITFER